MPVNTRRSELLPRPRSITWRSASCSSWPPRQSPRGLRTITHQISYDGVHFSGIAPGDTFDIGGNPFWYRAYLERLDSNFNTRSKPLPTSGQDPVAAAYYRLGAISAIDVGNHILERTITLDLLSQATQSPRILALREFSLPGTLSVYPGAALLGPQEYTFLNNALSFGGNEERLYITIRLPEFRLGPTYTKDLERASSIEARGKCGDAS